ncbi:tetratricopeptide repeat protein [Oceanobacillus senegalensis]|uniref:tetratricopeptide repeat protein n=1 Tax=Oceanobacillus senegalensis TaxID=1936063 RepID=UPI000A30FD83|nr:tetratricopeptide repeat protein [Oceanobacillus senegalensis]
MINTTVENQQSPTILTLCANVKDFILHDTPQKAKVKIMELENKLESKPELVSDDRFLILSTLAKYYRKIKQYDKAGNYSRQAIRMTKDVSKEYIEVIIDTYLDYAALEREYGQQSTARIELAKLLAFLDANDYKDSLSKGHIFSSLARISMEEENMESGLAQLEKALVYYHKAVPTTHPIISKTVDILSGAYIQIENYPKAIELYEELRKAYREQGDKESEARILLKIGEVNFRVDLRKARKTITDAIKLMDEIYKGNHLEISKAILMLAEIDENLGNFPRAINYYKQALQQLTSFYDENHFMIVFIYSKIGTLSIKTFKWKNAREYLEKGLVLSTPFPKVRSQFLYALGKIYSDEKDFEKAFAVFQEFLEQLEKGGKKKSLACGNTLQAIAFNYVQQEKYEEAFSYYKKALEIYENLPNCKEEKGLTSIRLAYCYENMEEKDIQRAEYYIEKGFYLIERARNKELIEEALAGIIEFYTRNLNQRKRRMYEDKFVKLRTKPNEGEH